jgi:hypothetical protein
MGALQSNENNRKSAVRRQGRENQNTAWFNCKTRQPINSFSIIVQGKTYTERKAAGQAIFEAALKHGEIATEEKDFNNKMHLGKFAGFDLELRRSLIDNLDYVTIKGKTQYTITLSDSEAGSIIRLENVLNSFEEKLELSRNELDSLLKQQDLLKKELVKPFVHQGKLDMLQKRQTEINAELDLDKR